MGCRSKVFLCWCAVYSAVPIFIDLSLWFLINVVKNCSISEMAYWLISLKIFRYAAIKPLLIYLLFLCLLMVLFVFQESRSLKYCFFHSYIILKLKIVCWWFILHFLFSSMLSWCLWKGVLLFHALSWGLQGTLLIPYAISTGLTIQCVIIDGTYYNFIPLLFNFVSVFSIIKMLAAVGVEKIHLLLIRASIQIILWILALS